MTLTPFATASALNAFTGLMLDSAQADQVLSQVTADIQAWTKQALVQVVGDVVTVDPQVGGTVLLPERPITAVTTLEWLDDMAGQGWQVIDPSYYRFTSWGQVYLIPNGQGDIFSTWPTDYATIRATYTHGYVTIPDDLVSVCVKRSARMVSNPFNLIRSETGGVRPQFFPTRGLDSDFTDSEQAVLARYTDWGIG